MSAIGNDPHASRRVVRLWLRTLLGVAGLVLVLAGVFATIAWRMVQQPSGRHKTHADQISADLRAHGLNVYAVYIADDTWNPLSSTSYGSSLTAHVPETSGSTPVPGRVQCRAARTRCWYQISALGVGPRDLPDLWEPLTISGVPARWQQTVRDLFVQIGVDVKVR
jgi:hypothetical protein